MKKSFGASVNQFNIILASVLLNLKTVSKMNKPKKLKLLVLIVLFHGKTMKGLPKLSKAIVKFTTLIKIKCMFVNQNKKVMITFSQTNLNHTLLEEVFGVSS